TSRELLQYSKRALSLRYAQHRFSREEHALQCREQFLERFLAALSNRPLIFPFVVCKKDVAADGDTVDDRGLGKFTAVDGEISSGHDCLQIGLFAEYYWNAIRSR